VIPLLAHVQEGIYFRSADAATEYQFLNAAGEQLLGCRVEELRADPDLLLTRVHPDDRDAFESSRSEPGRAAWPIELRYRHRDGAYVTLSLREIVLRDDGRAVGVAGMFFSAEGAGQDENALRRALAREQSISDRFRRLDEMRQGFLRAISHELRTPLTAVLGYADTLRTHRDQLGSETIDKVIDRIMGNAERLRILLDDLLDIDRMSRGTLELATEPVELDQVVIRAIESQPAGTVRMASESVTVEVEPAKIERVVDNLVHNGLKHGGPGVTVWVTITQDADWALLTIEDDGVGFDDAVLERAFDAFEQGDATRTMSSPGAGLGLTYVYEIVALHGGTVDVSNAPTGGGRIVIRLPRVKQ